MGRVRAVTPTCRASSTAARGAAEATCLDCMFVLLVLPCLALPCPVLSRLSDLVSALSEEVGSSRCVGSCLSYLVGGACHYLYHQAAQLECSGPLKVTQCMPEHLRLLVYLKPRLCTLQGCFGGPCLCTPHSLSASLRCAGWVERRWSSSRHACVCVCVGGLGRVYSFRGVDCGCTSLRCLSESLEMQSHPGCTQGLLPTCSPYIPASPSHLAVWKVSVPILLLAHPHAAPKQGF